MGDAAVHRTSRVYSLASTRCLWASATFAFFRTLFVDYKGGGMQG